MRVLQYQLDHGHIAYQWSHEPRHQPLIVLHGLGDSAIHTYAPRFARGVLRDEARLDLVVGAPIAQAEAVDLDVERDGLRRAEDAPYR